MWMQLFVSRIVFVSSGLSSRIVVPGLFNIGIPNLVFEYIMGSHTVSGSL